MHSYIMIHVTHNTAYILQYKSHCMTSHIISQLAFCLSVALSTAPGGATRMPFRTKQTHVCLEELLCHTLPITSSSRAGSHVACAMVPPQSPSSFSGTGENATPSVFS